MSIPNFDPSLPSKVFILYQGMDASLGSITQKVNNGKSGSGDLRETFIRKRISSPNPVSKGNTIKNILNTITEQLESI